MSRISQVALLALLALLAMAGCKSDGEVDPAEAAAKIERDLVEAETRLRNNKIKDAEKIYLRILEQDPEHPDALTGIARVRFSESDYESAEILFKRAIDRRGDNPKTHAALGEVYVLNGRHAEAATEYGKAFELDSENSDYGLAYGIALKKSAQYATAEKILRRVGELDPMAQFVHTELADVLREQGRLDEALKTYMKAQNTYASDKMARAGAALVYEAKGDNRHALDEWSAYIRMDCCSDYSDKVAKKKVMELKTANPTPPAGDDAPVVAEGEKAG